MWKRTLYLSSGLFGERDCSLLSFSARRESFPGALPVGEKLLPPFFSLSVQDENSLITFLPILLPLPSGRINEIKTFVLGKAHYSFRRPVPLPLHAVKEGVFVFLSTSRPAGAKDGGSPLFFLTHPQASLFHHMTKVRRENIPFFIFLHQEGRETPPLFCPRRFRPPFPPFFEEDSIPLSFFRSSSGGAIRDSSSPLQGSATEEFSQTAPLLPSFEILSPSLFPSSEKWAKASFTSFPPSFFPNRREGDRKNEDFSFLRAFSPFRHRRPHSQRVTPLSFQALPENAERKVARPPFFPSPSVSLLWVKKRLPSHLLFSPSLRPGSRKWRRHAPSSFSPFSGCCFLSAPRTPPVSSFFSLIEKERKPGSFPFS